MRAQHVALLFFELELVRKQLANRISGLADPPRSVFGGSGKDVIQLVRQDACHGATKDIRTIGLGNSKQIPLDEQADAVAIDVAERKNLAIADVGPTQRPGITVRWASDLRHRRFL